MGLNKDIIPVMYMGGTGGHFLSAFIRAARAYDEPSLSFFNLSNNGNAHKTRIDLGSTGGVTVPVDVQIADILKKNLTDPPCYPPMHLIDTDAVMQVFEKAIKITYNGFDIYEIANIFFIKWGIDEGNFKITNIDEYREKLRMVFMITFRNHRYFRPNYNYKDRLLNISWKDVYEQDADNLILKLSNFLDIPGYKFPKKELEEWRSRTKKGVDLVNEILNTDNIGLLKNDYLN
jgi:hypothetical protein